MGKHISDGMIGILAAAFVAGMAPVAIHGFYDHLSRKTSREKVASSRDRSTYHTNGARRVRDSRRTTRGQNQSPHRTDETFTSETDEFGDGQDDSADDEFYIGEEEGLPFPDGIYESLKDEGYIRVMKLHKGEGKDNLCCTLSQIHLEDKGAVKFDAISYVWGSIYPSKVLLCDNVVDRRGEPSPLTITPSLYSALMRFRLPNRDRWLWADAVCINQKDDNEKSRQVQLMAEIYAKARFTLIWLGSDRLGARCLNFFKTLVSKSGDDHDVKEEIRQGVERIFPDDGYRQIRLFFQDQEWFSRRWVIQEVAESHFPVVYCRDSEITWPDFVAGVNLLTQFSPREFDISGTDINVLTKIKDINVLWKVHNAPFRILDLLTVFHSSECDRNRDRIYALMNLTDIKITPDYSRKRYEHIYLEFGRQCVGSEGIDILHCGPAFQHKHEHESLSWPSWIPDWSQKPSFMSLLDMKTFSAGGRLRRVLHLTSRKELSVRGRAFDDGCSIRIGRLRQRIPKRLEKVHTWIAELMPKFRNGPPEYDDLESFAITLVAGRCHVMSLKSSQENFASEGREARDEESLGEHITGFFDLLGYAKRAGELVPVARTPSPAGESKYPPFARKYAQLVQATMEGRRFFFLDTPQNTYLGIGPIKMKKDDIVAIFDGARTPFVIRRKKEPDRFRLIGDCYIHGLMKGEALELGLPTHDFRLL